MQTPPAFFDDQPKHWKLFALTSVFVSLFVVLGAWQIHRGNVKNNLLTSMGEQKQLPALALRELSENPSQRFRQTILHGKFDTKHFWLLDNRSRSSRLGYDVIMPFHTDTDSITVLVNRGWVPSPARRDELPIFFSPNQSVTISAHVYGDEKNAVFHHSKSDWHQDWPKRVLQLTSETAKQHLNRSLVDTIVRIDSGSPGALDTHWPIQKLLKPERHYGYALQWFTMAFFFAFLSLRLLNHQKTEERSS